MTDLPHLRLRDSQTSVPYTHTGGGGGGKFRSPPRDRVPHARRIRRELEEAASDFAAQVAAAGVEEPLGIPITLRSDPGFPLKLDSLDRPGSGIEILSVGEDGGTMVATVFVPRRSFGVFWKLLEQYETKENRKSGKPRNQPLVDSIASARLALAKDFWRDNVTFPEASQPIMWEIWLRAGEEGADAAFGRFAQDCQAAGLRASAHFIAFPDRVVSLAFGTTEQISRSVGLLSTIAELRRAKQLATAYVRAPARLQRQHVEDFLSRVTYAGDGAPAVCVLDTGVNAGHPLLARALDAADTHAVNPSWGTADHDPQQHGTGMAGIALFGCLTDAFATTEPIVLNHRLESAKILPTPPLSNEEEVYGYVTEQAVARAVVAAPDRRRVICMAITTDARDAGVPSSWSGALDQMCSGVADEIPKLMFVSAGNLDEIRDASVPYVYPSTNYEDAGVEDPAQAWNVVTVGAYSEKVFIEQADFAGWAAIGDRGDLSPASRTSLAWGEESYSGWPIKPEIVMEGGNWATDGANRDTPDDLSLLTTKLGADGGLLQCTGDTSPATADASRMAAMLWSAYPRLWPETIRGLVVHSARWTDPMLNRFPGVRKADVHKRLRCYGYGVPNLRHARYSAENDVTLIFEGEIQPFCLDGSSASSNEMHLHDLPWPTSILEELGAVEVTMRVTLSYFVEPNPGRRGWVASQSNRYQSHGLRFDVIRPTESPDEFMKRMTRAAWIDPTTRPTSGPDETRRWTVGPDGRTHGSIHSDWWTGPAAELAASDRIAVYPVTGWWRERPKKGRATSTARYSLIVTIETASQDVDIYSAIAANVEVETDSNPES